jgi:hypothetical protein
MWTLELMLEKIINNSVSTASQTFLQIPERTPLGLSLREHWHSPAPSPGIWGQPCGSLRWKTLRSSHPGSSAGGDSTRWMWLWQHLSPPTWVSLMPSSSFLLLVGSLSLLHLGHTIWLHGDFSKWLILLPSNPCSSAVCSIHMASSLAEERTTDEQLLLPESGLRISHSTLSVQPIRKGLLSTPFVYVKTNSRQYDIHPGHSAGGEYPAWNRHSLSSFDTLSW